MQFYHWAYGINQWLANQGYVVMSINYRGGVGYGRSFRSSPGTGGNGNAEYQDVVAGGKYLQSRRQRDVYYELIVFPDDMHESMLHSRWMYTLDRMEAFLRKFLGPERKGITDAGRNP